MVMVGAYMTWGFVLVCSWLFRTFRGEGKTGNGNNGRGA